MNRFRSVLTSAVFFTKNQISLRAREKSANGRTMLGAGVAFAGVALLVLALGFSPAMFAQSSDTGNVRGTVTDEQGRAITEADVTILNTETGLSRSGKTDATGSYGFQGLPVGHYTLTVESTRGFKTFQEKDINLHVHDNLTFDAKLEVGFVACPSL